MSLQGDRRGRPNSLQGGSSWNTATLLPRRLISNGSSAIPCRTCRDWVTAPSTCGSVAVSGGISQLQWLRPGSRGPLRAGGRAIPRQPRYPDRGCPGRVNCPAAADPGRDADPGRVQPAWLLSAPHRTTQKVNLSAPLQTSLDTYLAFCRNHLRCTPGTLRCRTRHLTRFLHFLESHQVNGPAGIQATLPADFLPPRSIFGPRPWP